MFIRGSKMGEVLNVGSRHSTGVIAKINDDDTNDEVEKEPSLPSAQKKLEVNTGTIPDRHLTDASDKARVPTEICISNSSDEKSFQIGDRVEGKFRGRGSRWYKGVVSACLPNGLYTIAYDDGDEDRGLSVEFIRRLPSNSDNMTQEKQQEKDRKKIELVEDVSKPFHDTDNRNVFEVGQKVEAKYRGRGRRHFKGVIVDVLPNDLYNINYDDGDRDKKLPASAIRSVPGGGTKSPQMSTNAKFRGSASGRGSSSIEAIKPLENTNTEDKTNGEASEGHCGGFQRGQIVESRYRGRGRQWYKGTVTGCFPNGTYNIQYDDGDNDFELPAKYISALDVPPSDKVVVEGSKADTPKLQKCKDERSVESSRVESIGADVLAHKAGDGEGFKSNESRFNKGDRVEGKFRGRGSRWYKGIVAACLPNGTHTVQYDDGDKDSRLPASAIRAITRGADAPDVAETKLARSKQPSACAHISADDGDVLFVAPTDNGGKATVAKKPSSASKISVEGITEEELSQVKDVISEETESCDGYGGMCGSTTTSTRSTQNDSLMQQHHSNTAYSGKGNRLYRGVVSKVKVVHLYEIEYEDGTKDVNIPFGALCTQEGVTGSDVQVGKSVDVLSWQDRFWSSNQ